MKLLVGCCQGKDCGIALYERYGGNLDTDDMSYVNRDGKRYCVPCALRPWRWN